MNDVNHSITCYKLKTADDAVEAMASIDVGVANGELTFTEANGMARIVHGFIIAIEKQLQP